MRNVQMSKLLMTSEYLQLLLLHLLHYLTMYLYFFLGFSSIIVGMLTVRMSSVSFLKYLLQFIAINLPYFCLYCMLYLL